MVHRHLLSHLRSPGVLAALLIACTALVYAPTLGYGFVYEDFNDYAALMDPRASLIDVHNPARRLTMISLWVSTLISDGQPWGFHLVSVVLHLVNCWLVYLVARVLFTMWPALFVLALFALHPIQVEAVAYVSSRADLLATTGVLLALLATASGSVFGAGVGLAFACLAKETSIMAWALVPLWAAWTRTPFPTRWWYGSVILLLPFTVDAYAVAVTHFQPSIDFDHITRTATAIWRLLLLMPIPVGFTIDHDWHGVPLWLWGPVLMGTCLVTAHAALEGWERRWWPAWAWLFTIVTFAPRFLVPTPEGLHEHHVYGIFFAWCLCAGAWLAGHAHFQGRLWPTSTNSPVV